MDRWMDGREAKHSRIELTAESLKGFVSSCTSVLFHADTGHLLRVLIAKMAPEPIFVQCLSWELLIIAICWMTASQV